MAKAQSQTRLGKACRDLADKIDTEAHPCPDIRRRLEFTAADLDRAVQSTGRKGDGIKSLFAYSQAARLYREVSGEDYVPASK